METDLGPIRHLSIGSEGTLEVITTFNTGPNESFVRDGRPYINITIGDAKVKFAGNEVTNTSDLHFDDFSSVNIMGKTIHKFGLAGIRVTATFIPYGHIEPSPDQTHALAQILGSLRRK